MGMELPSNNNRERSELEEPDYSDYEIASYVRNALRSVTGGETWNEHYQQLIGVVRTAKHLAPDGVALLVASLKALSKAVSDIHIVHHKALLTSIFEMSMWNYGLDVMDALVELTICLAASGGQFVDLCLDMLVRNFVPPESSLHLMDEKKTEVLNLVHSALEKITDLVPLASLRLEIVIVHRMPHIFKGDSSVIYVENMLKLESSKELGKFVGTRMLTEVLKRLLELDVEIGWDDILCKNKRDENLQDDFSKGIFDLELEVIEEDEDYAVNIAELAEGNFGQLNLGSDTFDILDTLMVLTFEHLDSCIRKGRLVEVFDILLVAFEKMILTAYKSKFSQFVIFYACSLDPENCGVRFADKLTDIFERAAYPLVRMSAVAYLASYLSRGRFLSSSLVARALERLVDWCLKYCKLQDGEEKTTNPGAHGVFYSACQAVMYVLCFRMRYMMDVPHLKSKLLRLPLDPILRHPLDPLKVCLPTIVMEFLLQAKAAKLLSVTEKSFFNNLLESDLSKAYGGKERLDMFFPFDPCLLKNCDRKIRPEFIYWSMIKKPYDNDKEDDDSDEDGEADFVDNRNGHFLHDDDMGRSFDEDAYDLDEFEISMNKMSITPKSSFRHRLASDLQMSMQMPARIRPSTSPESL